MIQVQLKLRLTKAQERRFERWLWHMTGAWNWGVKTLEREPSLSFYQLAHRVIGHAKRIGLPSDVLRGTLQTAHVGWARYRRGISARPRLKGHRRPLSSIAFGTADLRVKGRRVKVRGTEYLRFHPQPIPAGHVGACRIVRRASGWYLCLFIQAERQEIERTADGQIGIDPGFSSLLTFSTGEVIEHPRELEADANRLAQAQRGQRKHLTARLHERISSRRKDRNHKLSRRLVAHNRLIAFSADHHKNIARRFGKSVGSSGHRQLRQMLAYKSLAGGAQYVEVPSRNSTRTCSACGALTGPTGWAGLKVRSWVCADCGSEHGRDCNAAINALKAGLGMRLKNGCEAVSGIASSVTPRNSSGPA